MKVPKRLRFRTSVPPTLLSEDDGSPPPTQPPPAYDDPAHSTLPPPVDCPSSHPSTHPSPRIDMTYPLTPGSMSTDSLHPHRNGMDVGDDDRPDMSQVPALDLDPNIMAMLLEDYRRTRVYVRELEWKEARRKLLQRHLYKWYALAIVVIIISALLAVKHDTVVRFTEPLTQKVRSWPGGWLIPIMLLIIVSFPPLIGHEIIGILCGLVWGFGEGFGILAAGTFFGECATWIAFKWFCTARAKKFEKKNKLYWALTQLIREKSFAFVLILRFSAVPGHIVTAVSASAGANVISYMAAATLTLPKQLTIAYLGHSFDATSTRNTIISASTTVITLIMTVVAAVYIYYQMRMVMRRQERLESMTLPSNIQDLNTFVAQEMAETSDLTRRRTIHGSGLSGNADEKIDLWADIDDVRNRKPWLVNSQSGRSARTVSRARSLPGPMNEEEMRAWMGDASDVGSGRNTPPPAIQLDPSHAEDTKGENLKSLFIPPPFLSIPSHPSSSTPLYPISPDSLIPSTSNSPRSPNSDLPPSSSTFRTSRSRQNSLHRPSVSLDLPRSVLPPRGGREIADEADRYAMAKGAKRPDYGRSRAESRAALLGGPSDDQSDVASDVGFEPSGIAPWEIELEEIVEKRGRRSEEVSESLKVPKVEDGRRSESVNPSKDRRKGKEREYGRSRGESGAALLPKPKDGDSP